MTAKRRTQASRSADTREALVSAGRALFAARGFAEVGTEEIVRAAELTRGALYHHFADKTELFAAVFEAVEADVIGRIAAAIADAKLADPIAAMRLGASTWLDACGEPEVHQIALLDAPAALGLARWREIASRYSVSLVQGLLTEAIARGRIPPQPVAPLAEIVVGVVREGALYLANAAGTANRAQARRDIGAVIDRLLQSLGASEAPRGVSDRRGPARRRGGA